MATVDKKQRNLYYEKLYKMRGEIPVVLKSKVCSSMSVSWWLAWHDYEN